MKKPLKGAFGLYSKSWIEFWRVRENFGGAFSLQKFVNIGEKEKIGREGIILVQNQMLMRKL